MIDKVVVHEWKGQWWFWCVHGDIRVGPYDEREDAEAECQEYCVLLWRSTTSYIKAAALSMNAKVAYETDDTHPSA